MPKSRKRKISTKNSNRRKKQRSPFKVEPYEPVKLNLVTMPDIFGDMPVEKRRGIIKEIGKKSEEHFQANYNKLGDWFEEYDALYLLSYCSAYLLSAPEGIDPEATEGKLDFYQHYLEMLQAIALTKPRFSSSKRLYSKEAQALIDSSKMLWDSIFFRQFYSEKSLTDEELKKRLAVAELRGQTIAVKNAFYPQQTFQLARKLYSRISNVIEDNYEVEADKIFDVLWELPTLINDKFNAHLNKVRTFTIPKNLSLQKIWELYKKAFPSEENDEELFHEFTKLVNGSRKHFKYLLAMHADSLLSYAFCFSLDEVANIYGDLSKKEKLRKIFDSWSYLFEDLKSHNIEHFILDNPILKRPLIKLNEDIYFCPAIGTINHSLFDLMEILITQTNNSFVVEKYEKARSSLLESEVEALFVKYFPEAQVLKGSLWKDETKNITGENDLLVLSDTFAFVIECKAGKINASAKRGSVLKLKRVLKDLVVKASEQANNFIVFLSSDKKTHNLPTVSGKINKFDNSNIRYYVPLTITFESLGTVSANLRSCIDAGWIEFPLESLAPSIPLGDLEVIFEILENEIERTHYLIRRSQIEKSVGYRGDELDLLGFYLDTGFNIGEEKTAPFINLTMKSYELNPYFVAKAKGRRIAKPKLDLSVWWKDIVNMICERKPKNWIEIGYVLLNFSKKAQKDCEKNYKKLLENIRKKKTEHPINFMTMLIDPPQEKNYAVVIYPYTEMNKEERNYNINRIIEEVNINYEVSGIVCFSISIENPNYPYNASAYFPKELLGKTLKSS